MRRPAKSKSKPTKSKAKTSKSKPAKSKGAAKKAAGRPVPPDAVRVWRGFRLSSLAPQAFLSALGSVFIPVTAQLQRLYGLTAYLPTVPPLDKPDGLPDEIALVFYETQQAYNDTKLIVAGRAYSSLHSTVFAFPASQSGFPTLLADKLDFDTPYHVFSEAADWQPGFSQVFVGARKASVSPEQFAAGLLAFLNGLKARRPKGLDGAVVCVSQNWVLYWEHWKSEAASLHGKISDLPGLAERVLLQPSTPTPIKSSLTAHYPGLNVTGGESFNIKFPREA
jgi:hypothetical protein